MSWAVDVFPGASDSFKCDNCNADLKGDDLKPVRNMLERLDIGGEIPGGECPGCGALCYLVKPPPALTLVPECFVYLLKMAEDGDVTSDVLESCRQYL